MSAVTHRALRELALATLLTSFPATPCTRPQPPSPPAPNSGRLGSLWAPALAASSPHLCQADSCPSGSHGGGCFCLRPTATSCPDTFSSTTLFYVLHKLSLSVFISLLLCFLIQACKEKFRVQEPCLHPTCLSISDTQNMVRPARPSERAPVTPSLCPAIHPPRGSLPTCHL